MTAAPAVAGKPRVVVLEFTASSDELKRVASSVAEQVLTELSRSNAVEVLGTSDITALLGMERQRDLLGCSDSSTSCLAEISAAMGAPWIVSGNLAQLGKVTRLDLKLIRAADGKAVLREGKSLADESELFALVNTIVGRMLEAMDVKPAAIVTTPAASAPLGPWLVTGSGAAVAVGGGVLLLAGGLQRGETLQALSVADPVPEGVEVPDFTSARANLSGANTLMVTGAVVAGVGVAALVGGLTWKFSSGATVSVVPGPAAVLVRGEF